jgi:hypothetical protein
MDNFDDLFATRLYYIDSHDETNIIKILKSKLYGEGNEIEEINDLLVAFYNNYGITMSREEIEQILPWSETNLLIFNNFNERLEDMINTITNQLLNNIELTEDVICTLDKDDKNNLKKEKLKTNLKTNCSICMNGLHKKHNVIILKCTHVFHEKCIFKWFDEYSYKCPMCKAEAGKPKYNI